MPISVLEQGPAVLKTFLNNMHKYFLVACFFVTVVLEQIFKCKLIEVVAHFLRIIFNIPM